MYLQEEQPQQGKGPATADEEEEEQEHREQEKGSALWTETRCVAFLIPQSRV